MKIDQTTTPLKQTDIAHEIRTVVNLERTVAAISVFSFCTPKYEFPCTKCCSNMNI